MSANTQYYWEKLQNVENNPVGPYQSKYGTQIDATLDKIVNRQPFSYDFNADPLYQNYKDQYTKLGNEAAMNAAANASALTGGYGNSYAVTAGAQANQQYLTQLNQVIPELYNAAMNKYQIEGDQLNNVYGVLGSAEDRNYGQYRDKVSDWQADRNYYQGAYGTQLNADQWQQNFDYQKQRDAVTDSQWKAEYALKAAKAAQGKADATAAQYSGSGTNMYYSSGGKRIPADEYDKIRRTAYEMYSGRDSAIADVTGYLRSQLGDYNQELIDDLLWEISGGDRIKANNAPKETSENNSGYNYSQNDYDMLYKLSNYDPEMLKKLTGKA